MGSRISSVRPQDAASQIYAETACAVIHTDIGVCMVGLPPPHIAKDVIFPEVWLRQGPFGIHSYERVQSYQE
jgi:hypothetical protein